MKKKKKKNKRKKKQKKNSQFVTKIAGGPDKLQFSIQTARPPLVPWGFSSGLEFRGVFAT